MFCFFFGELLFTSSGNLLRKMSLNSSLLKMICFGLFICYWEIVIFIGDGEITIKTNLRKTSNKLKFTSINDIYLRKP